MCACVRLCVSVCICVYTSLRFRKYFSYIYILRYIDMFLGVNDDLCICVLVSVHVYMCMPARIAWIYVHICMLGCLILYVSLYIKLVYIIVQCQGVQWITLTLFWFSNASPLVQAETMQYKLDGYIVENCLCSEDENYLPYCAIW